MNPELLKINVDLVLELIPGLLRSKIYGLNLVTLGDILNCTESDFRKLPGTGNKSAHSFNELKQKLINEPDSFLTLAERKTGFVQLPVNQENIPVQTPLDLFRNIAEDFLNLLENPMHPKFILLGYGIGSRAHSNDEIGDLFNLHKERIRQIQVLILKQLTAVLKGNRMDEPRSELRPEAKEILGQVLKLLYSKNIHSFESIKTLLSEEFNEEFTPEKMGILNLFLDAAGMVECGVRESYFTESKLYVTDIKAKEELLIIAQSAKDILKDNVISMVEPDIFIKVRNTLKKAQANNILAALSALPEIESIVMEECTRHQIKFDILGNARDLTYRILFEHGQVMKLDQIVSAINSRLANNFSNNIYDRNSLGLSTDKRFTSLNKSGYWGLTEWKINRDSIETLVRKAMHRLDKPSTQHDVVHEIHKLRPQVKIRSIHATIGRICLRVDTDKFILPVWLNRFPGLTIEKRKKRINTRVPEHHIKLRNKIISLISNCDHERMRSNEIIRRITSSDPKVHKAVLYKLMADERIFRKFRNENDKVLVELNPRINYKEDRAKIPVFQ